MWIFVFGIIGARINFILVDRDTTFWHFFNIWDGGLVFYGSAFGGAFGFLVGYLTILRRHNISARRMFDVLAPCIALGLALGRVGCLLNGCCYGHVACAECPGISFPLSSPARTDMVRRGYQTAAGFTLLDPLPGEKEGLVGAVEPHSSAAASGLKEGDRIVKVNGRHVDSNNQIYDAFLRGWPRGKTDLALQVRRGNADVDLPVFAAGTLRLHPTQIYETISATLIFFVLMTYYPLRQRDGMVLVLLMATYAMHRFLNEMLRTDTPDIAFGLTFSQLVSIVMLVLAAALAAWLLRQPMQTPTPAPATPQPVGGKPAGASW
jgi:phosphatidylglycerol:prolipoprotein diacylglycerol transferase